ncbi:kinase-like domain-containing protein [Dipodascopsis uninucleata]
MSTGLLSKRNRQNNVNSALSHLAPPDTPCKRPAQPHFNNGSSGLKTVLAVADNNDNDYIHDNDENDNDNEDSNDINGLSCDYEMPPTPTKVFGNSNSHDTFQFRTSDSQSWLMQSSNQVDSISSMSPTTTSLAELKTPSTPAKSHPGYFDTLLTTNSTLDTYLLDKFQDVTSVGSGEFSSVFVVSERQRPHIKYAVKRTKHPLIGQKALNRRLEEVAILKDLSSKSNSEDREYIINFVDSWEHHGHLYIMTELCENGNLDVFLAEYGCISKLDEWRVWKILVETALGLRFIHDQGYIHLDLKPANIFITFEGSLKIGDFGMATKLPAVKGIEREGDREYIAPEVLASQEYSKPADIFSLGLVMLEIAANIVLPDNGLPWQKLRSGDLSDAGRLSSSSSDLSKLSKNSELVPDNIPPWAPEFMLDEAGGLDKLVKWMLKPIPTERPTIHDILNSYEVQSVESRRKAGAIIYEGDFGPEPDAAKLDQDVGMVDEDEDWRMEL